MGIFDLFGKEPEVKRSRTENMFPSTPAPSNNYNANPAPQAKNGPIVVIAPKSYDDVSKIIDTVKEGKTPVVHLTELKSETALRILDMLSGAVYALGAGIYEMEKNVFLISPTGVEINT